MQSQPTNTTVIVYDQAGNTLAPCTHKRARLLLERNHATIVSKEPFAIQLTKPTGDTLSAPIGMFSGRVHICLSTIGQNRTAFLAQAICPLLRERKILFISTIVNERTLHSILSQSMQAQEIDETDNLFSKTMARLNKTTLISMIDELKPDVVVIDNWTEADTLRQVAAKKNVVMWYGLSTSHLLERMPRVTDTTSFTYYEEASLMIGLYGTQASLLKIRYGHRLKDKATHQHNLKFTYIDCEQDSTTEQFLTLFRDYYMPPRE